MPRRVHVPRLTVGETPLDTAQAHHARDVLRLTEGAEVEVFDDAGRVGNGALIFGATGVTVRVDRVEEPSADASVFALRVAAAVPKGDRADWMVEKLSELGVSEFVPLAAARSVVLPEGKNKRDRWVRIATEAAKQSRRGGVMRVAELTKLPDALKAAGTAWFLSTEAAVSPVPIGEAIASLTPGSAVRVFIGPEGGWTDEELGQFAAAGTRPVRLTETILRVETAAVAAAAVVSCFAPSATRVAAASPARLDGPGERDEDRLRVARHQE